MKSLILKIIDILNLYSLFNRYTKNTAAIFMLHRFTGYSEEFDDRTSAALLDEYCAYLRRNGYKVISLSDYVKILLDGGDTYKTVVFTVDDGYRDFYDHAFEVFKKYNYSATIFLTGEFIEGTLFFWWDTIEYLILNTAKSTLSIEIPGLIETSMSSQAEKSVLIARIVNHCKGLKNRDKLELINRLSGDLAVPIPASPPDDYAPLAWRQILEMRENGIEFCPHTMTHPILSKVSREQKMAEIGKSRNILREHLSDNCDIFCYPNGGADDFDDETISILKEEGYIAAVTGIPGFDNTKIKNDLFRLKRFSIPDKSILFKQYICGLERFKEIIL